MARMEQIGSILTALVALNASASGPDLYELQVLAPVKPFGGAFEITESGLVVGAGYGGGTYGFGWRWQNGVLTAAGPLECYIQGVNELGQAAGWYGTPGHATLFWPGASLPDCGGISGANDVANNGIVAGWCGAGSNYLPRAWVPTPSGTYGAAIALQTLPGFPYGSPYDLDESGTLIGSLYNVAVTAGRAVRWDYLGNGAFSAPADLPNLGGAWHGAYGIHPSGTIVGYSTNPGQIALACYWTGDGIEPLAIDAPYGSWAVGIALDGRVVGIILDQPGTKYWPCIWTSATATGVSLKDRIANLGTHVEVVANDINSAGWIVGYATRADGGRDAVILKPLCPADADGSGSVDGADLGQLLGNWGAPGAGDIDGNGMVDGADLGLMIAAWGPCEA